MTKSEAINFFKNNEERNPASRYIRVKQLSISALEKQIPKKPISYDDCEQFVIRCTCGKCTNTKVFHGYCTWCGQKLDWSDEE